MMKWKNYVLVAIGWLMAFIVGLFIGRSHVEQAPGAVVETRETRVDTIWHRAPVINKELVVGRGCYSRRKAGGVGDSVGLVDSLGLVGLIGEVGSVGSVGLVGGGNDSVVEVPILQRHYGDSTYEAWVSGPIDPRLDSVRVFARSSVVTKREWKPPKRWVIGLQAGYGYSKDGFRPYVGVGITYSIFSF